MPCPDCDGDGVLASGRCRRLPASRARSRLSRICLDLKRLSFCDASALDHSIDDVHCYLADLLDRTVGPANLSLLDGCRLTNAEVGAPHALPGVAVAAV